MTPILEFQQIHVTLEGFPALRGIDLSLMPGEILGILGESGSGKTTLLKTAMGLLEGGKVTGKLLFQGKPLHTENEKAMRQIRGTEMGLVFQDAAASLCPVRTVEAQILEALKAHGIKDRAQAKKSSLELLEKLNFSDPERVWNSYPMELSGGMNQRVGIALAMVLHPKVLFCDEPTSALDVGAARQFLEELKRIRGDFGTAIVLVTHDIGVVEACADRVVVMKDGLVVEESSQLLQNPRESYTRQLLSAAPRLRRD